MGAIASQITSLTIVYPIVYSDADQRKHQSSASLAFVRGIHRGPVNSPHKWPVTRKMFPFDDVIMLNWAIPHISIHAITYNTTFLSCNYECHLSVIYWSFGNTLVVQVIQYGGVEGPPHIFFRHHAISYGWHSNSSAGDSNYCYVIRRTY